MVRKITTLVALVSLFTAFNAVKAQEIQFIKTIHQGETLKLGKYISVVSKEQAKNLKDVKTCTSEDKSILYRLGEELFWALQATNSEQTDTVYIWADSIHLEKKLVSNSGENLSEIRTIVFYLNENNYSLSYVTEPEISTFTASMEDIGKAFSKVSKKNTQTQKKDLLDINFAIGVNYLNWANDGFYSLPQSSDPFSVKNGIRTDIFLQFIIFPKNLISISTGVGVQSNTFWFRNGFYNGGFITQPALDNYSIKESSLIARYITVPLTIDFNLNKDFRIHIGAIGGINCITPHSGFVRSFEEVGQITTQYSGLEPINPFKLDAMFGISFDEFTLYANYALTDMFASLYKFQARPFSFGIMMWY